MTDGMMDAAVQWHAAQDAEDMDWVGFTAWLESDPRHRAAYDSVALLDAEIVAHRAAIAGQVESGTLTSGNARSRRWAWAGAGIAAALALAAGLSRETPDHEWTAQDAARVVALNDGSRITLAPHSRLVALEGDQNRLELTGVAYFDVPHRRDRTLTIRARDYEVTDIGTRFEIVSEPQSTRVAVAEGRLTLTAQGLPDVEIAGGQGFVDGPSGPALIRFQPAAVGSWRHGQLIYAATPLKLVAADITRYSGTRVAVDPLVADRRFSGALAVGDGTKLAESVAAIMALRSRRVADGVRLEPVR